MADSDYGYILPKDAMAELYRLVQSQKEKILELEDERIKIVEDNQQLQKEIDHLQHTRSWKITEPLRRIEPYIHSVKKENTDLKKGNVSETAVCTEKQAGDEIQYDLNELKGQEQIIWDRSDIKCKVSVIIPTLNAGSELNELLTSLQDQEYIQDLEIVIVDSGSIDDTVKIALNHGAKVVRIQASEFSHSNARNLGARDASGKILVFMVQDARPGNTMWLADMCSLIYQNRVIATSCTEKPAENIDEYYKIGAKGYELFRCIEDGKDVINSYCARDSIDALRRKASLSDVGLAIKTDVFKKYQYRYDFAEDLDLGIRLLKDSNKIALLGSIYVQHGHSRNAEYYFKRWYLEKRALNNILGLVSETKGFVSVSILVADFLVAVNNLLSAISKEDIDESSTDAFFNKVLVFFDESSRECGYDIRYISEVYKDYPLLTWCFQQMAGAYYSKVRDYSLFVSLREYVMRSIKPYYKQNGICKNNGYRGRDLLCDCLIKQVAGIVGAELANLDDDCVIKTKLSKSISGV